MFQEVVANLTVLCVAPLVRVELDRFVNRCGDGGLLESQRKCAVGVKEARREGPSQAFLPCEAHQLIVLAEIEAGLGYDELRSALDLAGQALVLPYLLRFQKLERVDDGAAAEVG